MRYLITGSAGFIGSHLAESLLADGHAVLGVDCFNDNYGRDQKLANLHRASEWTDYEFVPIDLARGDLYSIVAECDGIFHLAAEPGVRPSWGDRFGQYVQNNVIATQHLLEAVKATPSKRFVYASSSSIYGEAESFPTPEEVTPRPISPYGMTKLSAEHLCSLYHHNHGVEAVTMRLFTVYGPRQRPDMAFNIFCRAAIDRSPIEVFGDGSQTRDFTYVGDVVTALRSAAEAPAEWTAGSAFNVGGGSQASVNHALELIADIAAVELDVRYTGRQAGDVTHTSADTTRAREQLGFAPETSLAEGLAAEFEWASSAVAPR